MFMEATVVVKVVMAGLLLASIFTWTLLLVCGDPSAPETYFGGFPQDKVSPISCPDNVAFDGEGNLYVLDIARRALVRAGSTNVVLFKI